MRFKTIYFRSISTLFIFVICIAAQLRFVTEIASKSPSWCVNRSPIRSGFRVCAKAIWYRVNIPSVVRLKVYHNAPYRPLSRGGHFVRGTQRQFLEISVRKTIWDLEFSEHLLLSNDPGKVDSNFFCYAARCFPHIGMFSFLHRECINLHEGRLRNKMHLHSTLKGCFFVLKDFDQSQELKTIAKKSLQFYMFPT